MPGALLAAKLLQSEPANQLFDVVAGVDDVDVELDEPAPELSLELFAGAVLSAGLEVSPPDLAVSPFEDAAGFAEE